MTPQTFYTTENARKVYNDLCRTDGIYELRTKLIHTAARKGLSFFEAEEAADGILEGIRLRGSLCQDLWSDTEGCLDQFTRSLNFRPYPETTINMLYLGMKHMDDPAIRAALKDTPEDALLFVHSADLSLSADEKLNHICRTLRSFNCGSSTLQDIIYHLTSTNYPIQTVIDYTREHLSRNALAAMELYLHSRDDLTPQMAAVISCTFEESRDLNKAIQAGREHKEYISGEVEAYAILALIIGVIALTYLALNGEVIMGLLAVAVMAGIYATPFLFRNVIGTVLGRARVEYDSHPQSPNRRALPAPDYY